MKWSFVSFSSSLSVWNSIDGSPRNCGPGVNLTPGLPCWERRFQRVHPVSSLLIRRFFSSDKNRRSGFELVDICSLDAVAKRRMHHESCSWVSDESISDNRSRWSARSTSAPWSKSSESLSLFDLPSLDSERLKMDREGTLPPKPVVIEIIWVTFAGWFTKVLLMPSLVDHQTTVCVRFEIMHEPLSGSNICMSLCSSLVFEVLLPDPSEVLDRFSCWSFAERWSFARDSHDSSEFHLSWQVRMICKIWMAIEAQCYEIKENQKTDACCARWVSDVVPSMGNCMVSSVVVLSWRAQSPLAWLAGVPTRHSQYPTLLEKDTAPKQPKFEIRSTRDGGMTKRTIFCEFCWTVSTRKCEVFSYSLGINTSFSLNLLM